VSTNSQSKEKLQLDLYSLIDLPDRRSDTVNQFSNSIVELDRAPRFMRGKNPPRALHAISQKPTVVERPYVVSGQEFVCEIKPAIITRKSGDTSEEFFMYPGDKEELIERMIFLIGAKRGLVKRAMPDSPPRYGIEFSIYEIHKELAELKKTKAFSVIIESLEIIRDSRVVIYKYVDGKRKSINKNVFTTVYLETSGKGRGREKCFVALSDDTINQIHNLRYRQYSLTSVLSHTSALARFIHQYLHFAWAQCYTGATFDLSTISIMTAFGKGDSDINVMRRDMRIALKSLVDKNIIESVPYARNNIYTITATKKLYQEIYQSMQKKAGIEKLSDKIDAGELLELPNAKHYHSLN